MGRAGKSSGNNGAVLASRPAESKCGDCANGSIEGWQQAARRVRGLAGIVARGGGPADAPGDPLGGLAGHPAPPFATADLSVFPSGNHLVRFLVRVPGLADRSGVAGPGSFDGHPWPCLPINVLRRQVANLHSFVVIGPTRFGLHADQRISSRLQSTALSAHDERDRDARRGLALDR